MREIFAILKTDNADEWYNFIMADGKDDFNRRVSDVKVRSLFKSDITLKYGQQLLTLSTCYGSSKTAGCLYSLSSGKIVTFSCLRHTILTKGVKWGIISSMNGGGMDAG